MDGEGPVWGLGAELGVICCWAGEGVEGVEDGLEVELRKGVDAIEVGWGVKWSLAWLCC